MLIKSILKDYKIPIYKDALDLIFVNPATEVDFENYLCRKRIVDCKDFQMEEEMKDEEDPYAQTEIVKSKHDFGTIKLEKKNSATDF
jgi:hypothetical protein